MKPPVPWSEGEIVRFLDKWRANLPVQMIAQEMHIGTRRVQALVRELDLPHRPTADVIEAGRNRRHGTPPIADDTSPYPVEVCERQAAAIAREFGLKWTAHRGDLVALNRALDRAGRRPVFVPFCELRP